MSILSVVVTFSVIMGAVAFFGGLVNAIQLLRRAARGQGTAPVGSQLGAVLLVGIGGALVGTAMVTAAMVTDRESDLSAMKSELDFMQAKVRVYESGLNRMEKALEASRGAKSSGEKVAADLKMELNDLRQKRASLR